jgi:L-asparaginase II
VPKNYAELAIVERSGFIESRHFGSLLALSADGSTALRLGTPQDHVLPRSTYKPLQALGVLNAGVELSGEQLAVAIGSHVASDEHLAAVRSILQRYELDEALLACPPDYPEDARAREHMIRSGVGKQPICMNCSGKHAAMLAAAKLNGWPLESYLDPEHPLQLVIRETIERISLIAVSAVAVDGCGAALFSTTLGGIARSFQALAQAKPGTNEHRVAQAMREHPFFVQGEGQLNTLVMQTFVGSIAKGGAEGVFGMATAEGASVGIKVIDGSLRATTVIAIAALEKIGALPEGSLAEHEALEAPVFGGGRRVGSIQPSSLLRN